MILLDTHVLIWLVDDSPRMSSRARSLLRSAEAVYVSAVSHAELRIKEMIGKVALPDEWGARIDAQGLRPLPFTATHAHALAAFPDLARHDPFDRMLLAQARHDGLDFLTADRRLLTLALPRVHPAS